MNTVRSFDFARLPGCFCVTMCCVCGVPNFKYASKLGLNVKHAFQSRPIQLCSPRHQTDKFVCKL